MLSEELVMIDPMSATRTDAEQAIQAWRAQRAERLAQDKIAAKMKEKESALKSWLIAVFNEQQFEGMVIDQRITGVSPSEVHTVEDRAALQDYIIANGALDLLQFRISDAAIFLREEAGEVVPGVRVIEVYDLFDRKV